MDQGSRDLNTLSAHEQAFAPLTNALNKFLNRRPVYFCIPGHRFDVGVPGDLTEASCGNIINFDVTEAPGLDDLHNPKGVIKEAQELLADAYGSRNSRFLVNGTTCGIEAALMASVSPGQKILLPRNAHRSVLGGLVMSGAVPVWIPPVIDGHFGFPASVRPEDVREMLKNDPEIRAVHIVSPTYYGSFSDVSELAEICHFYGVPLIVDEAHGAHLYFCELKRYCAIPCGADISVMSAHKTLGSFGQSSYLHLNSELIRADRIDSALKMLMSSSPSYILMASLDSARREAVLHGREHYEQAAKTADIIRRAAKKAGYPVLEGPAHDRTRVVISSERAGLSGNELAEVLFQKYNIAVEMADRYNIVLVVTSANNRSDAEALGFALCALKTDRCGKRTESARDDELFSEIPRVRMSPRDAYFARKKTVNLDEAHGLTAAEEVVVYPPGCALIYPGEILDDGTINKIRSCEAAGLTLQKGSTCGPKEISVTAE